jgi:predicted nucleic acid-binding protein
VAQLVLDASAVIAVIAGETARPVLIEMAKGAELLAPASLPWEVGNALSAMLRRHRASLADAQAAASAFHQIPVRLVDVDLEEALELSARLGIYAYDAYQVVCARMARCPLVTLDAALAKSARAEGLQVVEVAS